MGFKKKAHKSHFKQGNIPHNYMKGHDNQNTARSITRRYTPVFNRTESGVILPPKNATTNTETVQVPKAAIKRYDKSFYKQVVKKGNKDLPISIPGADGKQGSKMILRPHHDKVAPQVIQKKGNFTRQTIEGNIIADKKCLLSHINMAIKEHSEQSADCDELQIDFVDCVKRGYSWRTRIKCVSCTFRSPRRALYETIQSNKPGPKAAKVNVGCMMGAQETSIGPERLNFALSFGGVATPSRSTCQTHANSVGDITHKLNEGDMSNKITQLKNVMEARGFPRDTPIAAQFDVQYNGPSGRAKNTPGHASHSAQGLLVEDITDKKYIIGTDIVSKYCSGKATKANVTCPSKKGKHGDARCTATVPQSALFDEGDMSNRIGCHLKTEHNLQISHLTTDSDGKGIQGIREAMDDPVIWYKDLTHLGKSQLRAVMNAEFSDDIFGDMKGPQKTKAKQALANDVPERTSRVHNSIWQEHHGNVADMQKAAKTAIEVMLRCYAGDHSKCKTTRFIKDTCNGPSGHTWFIKSQYLSGQGIKMLHMTPSDRATLRRVIEMKLGEHGIELTHQRATTQAAECYNFGLRTSLPKTKMFRRNHIGRIHGAINRLNNGPLRSAEQKLSASKCYIPKGSCAWKRIEEQQRRLDYNRCYRQRPSVIQHLRQQERKMKSEYFKAAKIRHGEVKYLSGLLEEEELVHQRAKTRQELRTHANKLHHSLLLHKSSTSTGPSKEPLSVKQARKRVQKTKKALAEAMKRKRESLMKKKKKSPVIDTISKDHKYTRRRKRQC